MGVVVGAEEAEGVGGAETETGLEKDEEFPKEVSVEARVWVATVAVEEHPAITRQNWLSPQTSAQKLVEVDEARVGDPEVESTGSVVVAVAGLENKDPGSETTGVSEDCGVKTGETFETEETEETPAIVCGGTYSGDVLEIPVIVPG